MFTDIDPRSSTPLYQQLVESVRRSVARGESVPGEPLPSVKALAARLRINPSAVSQAYREMLREGIAEEDGSDSQPSVRIARAAPSPSSAIGGERVTRLESGETIESRFRILRRLGAGAMGAVYLARDLELDEDVALKVLPPVAGADETAVRRFINEIRVARKISHPNVVRTHDVGRWQGGLFLTMEFVAGRTVRQEIDARGALPAAEVVEIARQLVEALIIAHANGVVHRDIKPQNLVLDQAGTLKVLDFGIAVTEGSSGQLTEAGMVVGTPAYMAPEQLLGDPVGAPADYYSTGVVLYEMLAGRLPYEATSPVALAAQIVQRGPAPLNASAVQAPERLTALVMAMLRHEAAARPTGPAVREALLELG
ncbi:MAG: protein kinase [Gemmatimonadaceae bacterium]|nr:protein kinase [Gemmatimonadaceae bacterium]